MAKKKNKYQIKLNNKIRNYFDGLAFEDGITTLEDDKLIELAMLLELDLKDRELWKWNEEDKFDKFMKKFSATTAILFIHIFQS